MRRSVIRTARKIPYLFGVAAYALTIMLFLGVGGCATGQRLYAFEEDAAKDAGDLIFDVNVSLLCNKTTLGGLRRNLSVEEIMRLLETCEMLEKETQ